MPQRVKAWPAYLLKRIPLELRGRLSLEAAELDFSVADVIRSVLCARYRMRCSPASYHYTAGKDSAVSETLHLKLQPKLHRALQRDATRLGKSVRDVILEALDHHYERKAA